MQKSLVKSVVRPGSVHPPGRYLELLSILGTVAVIGFHCELQEFRAGWIAVVFFFVLAGVRMVSAINRDERTFSYGLRRLQRLAPEFLCVYLVGLCWLVWKPSLGLKLFAATGMVFAHNWTRAYFDFSYQDWLFIPLWFVGALLQLQLLAMIFRRWLRRLSARALFTVAVVVGVASRLSMALFVGGNDGNIPVPLADTIYWTPFAHIEALVGGFLIGRGDWRSLGRLMPAIVAFTAILGVANIYASDLSPMTLGYPVGLPQNYEFLWGYPVLALMAMSCVSHTSFLRRWVDQIILPRKVDQLVVHVAQLTYGVYVFHGVWLVVGQWALERLRIGWAHGYVLFLITIMGGVFSAWCFEMVRGRQARRETV
jgi:peptidoglycan/LPS O-acetylase OafA/YrhL